MAGLCRSHWHCNGALYISRTSIWHLTLDCLPIPGQPTPPHSFSPEQMFKTFRFTICTPHESWETTTKKCPCFRIIIRNNVWARGSWRVSSNNRNSNKNWWHASCQLLSLHHQSWQLKNIISIFTIFLLEMRRRRGGSPLAGVQPLTHLLDMFV